MRVKTIFDSMSFNLFANLRTRLSGKNGPKHEYTFPISDIQFSEKDESDSYILRLKMKDLRFYCHRNRATYADNELIGAVFHSEVKGLKSMQ